MADIQYDDIVTSAKKLNQTRQKVKAKIAGMEDELNSTQKALREVADDIEEIQHLMDDTEEKMMVMEREFQSAGIFADKNQFKRALDDPEKAEQMKEDVQSYARLAREIHENLQKLEELTSEAARVTQEQSVVFKEVLEAEQQVDQWDKEMEKMDESIAQFMEEHGSQ